MKIIGWADYAALRSDFSGYGANDGPPEGFPEENEVLLAVDAQQSYEGSCVIYWQRDGKLFEAECGHCSCYGYSEKQAHGNQFSKPTEIPTAYLSLREIPYPIRQMGPEALVAWDFLQEASR